MKSLILVGTFHVRDATLESKDAELITPQAIRAPAFLKKKPNIIIKKSIFVRFNNYPVVLLSGKPPLPPSSLIACKTMVRLAIDRSALYKLISGSRISIIIIPLSFAVTFPRSPTCRCRGSASGGPCNVPK